MAGRLDLSQDARRVQAQLDQANALLAQQEARLAELQRGPRVELITQARAQLAGAEGTLASARHELERVRPLVGKQLLSPQDLDKARAATIPRSPRAMRHVPHWHSSNRAARGKNWTRRARPVRPRRRPYGAGGEPGTSCGTRPGGWGHR